MEEKENGDRRPTIFKSCTAYDRSSVLPICLVGGLSSTSRPAVPTSPLSTVGNCAFEVSLSLSLWSSYLERVARRRCFGCQSSDVDLKHFCFWKSYLRTLGAYDLTFLYWHRYSSLFVTQVIPDFRFIGDLMNWKYCHVRMYYICYKGKSYRVWGWIQDPSPTLFCFLL